MSHSDQPSVVFASVTAVGKSNVTAFAQLRTSLTQQRIESAVMFAKHAHSIEQANETNRTGDYRGYVIASITECGAFLESIVSEFLYNILEDCSNVSILNDELKRTFKAVAEFIERMNGVVGKFDKILELCQVGAIPKGGFPSQDVASVIELRNLLVHYKPRWQAAGQRSRDRIGQLEGRFATNPFIAAGNPFFPDRCLSYGCTKWAIEACLAFSDEFYTLIQTVPPYDSIRSKLVL